MQKMDITEKDKKPSAFKRFFAKKFKTRVRHYTEDQYTVQWANYRFIPIWWDLCYWFDQGHPGGTEGWSPNMWSYKEAEKIATSLKNRQDINEYYEMYVLAEREWRAEEKEWWKRHVPYDTKVITGK